MAKRITLILVCIILLTTATAMTAVSGIAISHQKELTLSILSESDRRADVHILELSYDFDGVTIYVDDDNTAGPWSGTQEYPYQYIQDGIDNASDSDTVFVYNGAYHENIVLGKTIRLVGEDKSSTIIDGGEIIHINATIDVSAENVDICGFTIKNILYNGCGISNIRDNCTIHRNIITETSTGILLGFDEGCFIYDNIINNNSCGINLLDSNDNRIVDNTIDKNDLGIVLLSMFDSRNKNNEISLNIITNNRYYGIALYGGEENEVYLNNIENNGNVGISLFNSKKSLIAFNKVENNGKNPDPLYAELPHGGIFLKNSSNIKVKFNNIQNNEGYGLNVVNCSVFGTRNWWGSLFGPSRTMLGFLGDRLIAKNSDIDVFPWRSFKNPLAGYSDEWNYIY